MKKVFYFCTFFVGAFICLNPLSSDEYVEYSTDDNDDDINDSDTYIYNGVDDYYPSYDENTSYYYDDNGTSIYYFGGVPYWWNGNRWIIWNGQGGHIHRRGYDFGDQRREFRWTGRVDGSRVRSGGVRSGRGFRR